jgi:hypothetical protein
MSYHGISLRQVPADEVHFGSLPRVARAGSADRGANPSDQSLLRKTQLLADRRRTHPRINTRSSLLGGDIRARIAGNSLARSP